MKIRTLHTPKKYAKKPFISKKDHFKPPIDCNNSSTYYLIMTGFPDLIRTLYITEDQMISIQNAFDNANLYGKALAKDKNMSQESINHFFELWDSFRKTYDDTRIQPIDQRIQTLLLQALSKFEQVFSTIIQEAITRNGLKAVSGYHKKVSSLYDYLFQLISNQSFSLLDSNSKIQSTINSLSSELNPSSKNFSLFSKSSSQLKKLSLALKKISNILEDGIKGEPSRLPFQIQLSSANIRLHHIFKLNSALEHSNEHSTEHSAEHSTEHSLDNQIIDHQIIQNNDQKNFSNSDQRSSDLQSKPSYRKTDNIKDKSSTSNEFDIEFEEDEKQKIKLLNQNNQELQNRIKSMNSIIFRAKNNLSHKFKDNANFDESFISTEAINNYRNQPQNMEKIQKLEQEYNTLLNEVKLLYQKQTDLETKNNQKPDINKNVILSRQVRQLYTGRSRINILENHISLLETSNQEAKSLWVELLQRSRNASETQTVVFKTESLKSCISEKISSIEQNERKISAYLNKINPIFSLEFTNAYKELNSFATNELEMLKSIHSSQSSSPQIKILKHEIDYLNNKLESIQTSKKEETPFLVEESTLFELIPRASFDDNQKIFDQKEQIKMRNKIEKLQKNNMENCISKTDEQMINEEAGKKLQGFVSDLKIMNQKILDVDSIDYENLAKRFEEIEKGLQIFQSTINLYAESSRELIQAIEEQKEEDEILNVFSSSVLLPESNMIKDLSENIEESLRIAQSLMKIDEWIEKEFPFNDSNLSCLEKLDLILDRIHNNQI